MAQQEVSRQMKRSDAKPAGQQKQQQPHQLQQQNIRRERQIEKQGIGMQIKGCATELLDTLLKVI